MVVFLNNGNGGGISGNVVSNSVGVVGIAKLGSANISSISVFVRSI